MTVGARSIARFGRPILTMAVLSAIASTAGNSHADGLRDVAARAKDVWSHAGAEVVSIAPRFLFDDETVSIRIPPLPKTAPKGCVTLAVVGP
ncbi:MAG: hypothetical protein ABI461_10255, partial [Polyangiaceae bacterium]